FKSGIKMPSVHSRRYKVAIVRDEGSNGDAEMAGAFRHAGFEAYDVCTADILNGSFTSFKDFRGAAFVGGFSRADVFGSARGWAAIIRHNSRANDLFTALHDRDDSFMLGVCNGCQLLTQLGWIPKRGIQTIVPPYLTHNLSQRYEYRHVGVRVEDNSIFTERMGGSVLPITVAHGEGRWVFDPESLAFVERENLVSMRFVNPSRTPTEMYPFNPNGSPNGITAVSSVNRRILAMMPHGERLYLKEQWPHWPKHWDHLSESPWLMLFRNAYNFCVQY
nr:phosphoribosylformylglycinamidine synthase subunit PurQ [Candidatus Paceibacterota bacterium]